ncbi:polysaccharide lyase 6 family protein [Synoicihabitans lomoniglobus]|uniref:Polysaccharide lyase 6 family protein n=1 Tax=Synoicihabitans lomoniglobus TaxID=2909285 RepID=A0AAF0CSF6_9BACT|nr:polysaccharide lyase 6 family protein [Opitutaceae bacterium LMO-M01]WED67220.1 polysaccharide lyase 6 family protein [Opitutaceae bacterium LMO-M01]
MRPTLRMNWIGLVLMAVIAAPRAVALSTVVGSESQLITALASARPGDEVVLANRIWTDLHIVFEGAGTPDQPIVLRAQTPGRVILSGDSTLAIGGNHLVVDGLVFTEGYPRASSSIIQFRHGDREAEGCRLTNTAIIDYNPPDRATRYFWVSLYGRRNRVDHCYFSGQAHSGVTVVAWLDGEPNDHRIDHNHFANHVSGEGENGWESIRIGTSAFVDSVSRTTVEFNLFEECDGELEIVSNKSCENVYRGNTFLRSQGMLTLRHGHRCLVDGNVFLGERVRNTGGIRVIGRDHVVINNYIHGTRGRDGAAISIYAGVPDAGVSSYPTPHGAVVAFNTIVDVTGPHLFYARNLGSGRRTELPRDVVIANNLLVAGADMAGVLVDGAEPEPGAMEVFGNIAFGREWGAWGAEGLTVADPLLDADADGLWRPTDQSPVVDAAGGAFPIVDHDRDGQGRAIPFDVGAFEVTAGPPTWAVATAGNTGPAWMPDDRFWDRGEFTNLSTRGRVGDGGEPLIVGVVVTASDRRLLLRAVGPGLAAFGVADVLLNPRITLFDAGAIVASNDRWGDNAHVPEIVATSAALGAFALDETSQDAVLLLTVPPGAYTVHLSSAEAGGGVGLLEIYTVPFSF